MRALVLASALVALAPAEAAAQSALWTDADVVVEAPSDPLWVIAVSAGPFTAQHETAPLVAVELDRFVRFAAGRAGVGVSVGALQACTGDDPHQTLTMVPASLGVVYRTPPLGARGPLPLEPSAKLGVAYHAWDLAGARGAKVGWRGALGLAVQLGNLDRIAQQNLARDWGIERTAIAAELTYFDVEGFAERLTWSLGLDFEF